MRQTTLKVIRTGLACETSGIGGVTNFHKVNLKQSSYVVYTFISVLKYRGIPLIKLLHVKFNALKIYVFIGACLIRTQSHLNVIAS